MVARHPEPNREHAREKRISWINWVTMTFPLPSPWYPLGDEGLPPSVEPLILSKKAWEREAKDWKKQREEAFRAHQGNLDQLD